MTPDTAEQRFADPMSFAALCWPDVTFYREQRKIIYSVVDNDETYVPAGNMLGKDFVAAFIALWFFCSRHPCRAITTSVDNAQLEGVLWGEIRRFIQSSKEPLNTERGGPLVVNHLHLRLTDKETGEVDGLSYLLGRVAAKGEGMLGHHIAKTGDGIPRTMYIADECSGVDDVSYERADTWADRKLIIGNPYPTTNFFYQGVKAGDVKAKNASHLYSKVIRIRGDDSPNVRYAHAQIARGDEPDNRMLVPGVLSYADYTKRRDLWDKIRQCIGLDAEFYEGAEVLLYPPDWLNNSETLHSKLTGRPRQAKAIGIDPAEGGDDTVWAVIDELGLIDLIAMKTPDTNDIPGRTLALMLRYKVPASMVLFDAGGGGKEHADRMRANGHQVRTVMFGESTVPVIKSGMTPVPLRKEQREEAYIYKNRRAEMYGLLRMRINPTGDYGGFAIPAGNVELRRQLSPIPLWFDEEGRMFLPPKRRRPDAANSNKEKITMTKLIGCSPDHADAVVLAVYGLHSKPSTFMVTSMI